MKQLSEITETDIQWYDVAFSTDKSLTKDEMNMYRWIKKCVTHYQKILKYEQELFESGRKEEYINLPLSTKFTPTMSDVARFLIEAQIILEKSKDKYKTLIDYLNKV